MILVHGISDMLWTARSFFFCAVGKGLGSRLAQLTRREFVKTSVSWAGSDSGHLVPLSLRGRWVDMSVSLVPALVSQLVLCSVIAWSQVRFPTGCWLFSLPCAGLPPFCD